MNRLSTTFLTLLLMFCFTSARSSNLKDSVNRPSALILEIGPAFSGTGDLSGRVASLEYSRQLNSLLGIGVNLHLASFPGGPFNGTFWSVYKCRGFEFNAYLYPFDKKSQLRGFFLSPGFHFRHWDEFYKTGPNTSAFISPDINMGPNTELTTRGRYFGYNVSAGYTFSLSGLIFGQVKACLQNDTEGNIVSGIRFGAGMNF